MAWPGLSIRITPKVTSLQLKFFWIHLNFNSCIFDIKAVAVIQSHLLPDCQRSRVTGSMVGRCLVSRSCWVLETSVWTHRGKDGPSLSRWLFILIIIQTLTLKHCLISPHISSLFLHFCHFALEPDYTSTGPWKLKVCFKKLKIWS